MNKFGVSAQTLVAAAVGAALMGSAFAIPKLIPSEAGAQPIAIQAPPGARKWGSLGEKKKSLRGIDKSMNHPGME